jgi:hypothetical protein
MRCFGLPFLTGSHLAIFMCPICNEVPCFEFFEDGQLPQEFWNATIGNSFAVLQKPSASRVALPVPPYLQTFRLDFMETGASDSIAGLSIGGAPHWLQDPERFACSCGTEMAFLCELPDNYAFPKRPDAPEQPDSFSRSDYCLFLGNAVYVFACPEQCNERAVWITLQN